MGGCFYSLGRNPDVQERLREEVRRVVGEDAVVTPQHIQDMHYLRDTIKETMRCVYRALIHPSLLICDCAAGFSL